MGILRAAAMKSLFLAVLVVLVESGEAKPSRSRRPEKGARVWHVAESEEQCGNTTSLSREEKPSALCNEVNVTFCLCTTRDTKTSTTTNTTEDTEDTEEGEIQVKEE